MFVSVVVGISVVWFVALPINQSLGSVSALVSSRVTDVSAYRPRLYLCERHTVSHSTPTRVTRSSPVLNNIVLFCEHYSEQSVYCDEKVTYSLLVVRTTQP